MVFVKSTRTAAYYSRFQVKRRRRREGKTDYQARRNLCRQEKSKYNTPKYRFVVRFTNARVICQIVFATIQGDKVVTAADSNELTRYGMPVGQTNYAAAYSTGLLCARRALKQLGLDSMFEGKTTVDGEEYHIEEEENDRRAFKCVLDIGLVRTTTGNRVFGALKGAIDGGLHIPHSNKRFPGFAKGEDGAENKYDAEAHRKRIFGVHVADYMTLLKEEEPDKFDRHFARYLKAGITAENMEETVKSCHAAIRANPVRVKTAAKKVVKAVRDGHYIKTVGKDGSEIKFLRPRRLNKTERAERVQVKIDEVRRRALAAMADAE